MKAKHKEDAITLLADRVVDSIKEQDTTDLESFEIYSQRLKSTFHKDLNLFKKRFIKGYTILATEK